MASLFQGLELPSSMDFGHISFCFVRSLLSSIFILVGSVLFNSLKKPNYLPGYRTHLIYEMRDEREFNRSQICISEIRKILLEKNRNKSNEIMPHLQWRHSEIPCQSLYRGDWHVKVTLCVGVFVCAYLHSTMRSGMVEWLRARQLYTLWSPSVARSLR